MSEKKTYTYLLNNGGEYSDYGVTAIVQSDHPVNWPEVKAAILGQINDGPRPDPTDWFWAESKALELLDEMPGIRVLAYEELSFSVRGVWPDVDEDGVEDAIAWEWES